MVSILGRGRESAVALVDVRRGSASVAIVLASAAAPAKILAHGRSHLQLEERANEHAQELVAQHIEEAAKAALDMYATGERKPAIRKALIVVHAPLASSETVCTEQEMPHTAPVRDELIVSLAKQAFAVKKTVDTTRMLDAGVLTIRLNGYPTASPAGKKASHIALCSILSDVEPKVKEKALSAVHTLFPAATVSWRSSMRALLTVLRDVRSSADDALIVDMGPDATHLISMRDGEVAEQRTVDEGVRTILARIGGERTADETLSLIRMLGRDACESAACEAVQKAILTAEPELARVFGEALGAMAAERHLPNDLLLLAHPDLTPWLSRFFTRIDFAQFTVTSLPFDSIALSSGEISRLVSNVEESIERDLAVGAALVNIEERSE